MSMILLACAPVALVAGLLWGFSLGVEAEHKRVSRLAARAAQQKAWEKHWAANREDEYAAAFAEMSKAPMNGDDSFARANERFSLPRNTHLNHGDFYG